jgi:hypothetical protein
MATEAWLWLAFIVFILFLLALDLGVPNQCRSNAK